MQRALEVGERSVRRGAPTAVLAEARGHSGNRGPRSSEDVRRTSRTQAGPVRGFRRWQPWLERLSGTGDRDGGRTSRVCSIRGVGAVESEPARA